MPKPTGTCTEYGKLLRHIRIDNSETANDMCKKLNVSPPLLNMVEYGKKNIPSNLTARLFKAYRLDNDMKTKLIKAEAFTKGYLHIDLSLIPNLIPNLDAIISNIFEEEWNQTINNSINKQVEAYYGVKE